MAEKMPIEIIHALALVKKVSCEINRDSGLLDSPRAMAISAAAQEIIDQNKAATWKQCRGGGFWYSAQAIHKQRSATDNANIAQNKQATGGVWSKGMHRCNQAGTNNECAYKR